MTGLALVWRTRRCRHMATRRSALAFFLLVTAGARRLRAARQSAVIGEGRRALRDLAIQSDVAHRSRRKTSRRSASLQHARLGPCRGRARRAGARRFQQGDQPRSQLRAGLRQPRAALSAERQARSCARRLQQGAVDRRQLRARLSRPRHRLPPARPHRAGARRLQQGDRAQARQCAGLLQSRPALSEPASAPIRHRRLLHRASG